MNRNATLILLAAFAFSAGSVWFYLCKIKQKCPQEVTQSHSRIDTNIEQALAFSWGESEVMRGKAFKSFKKQLMKDLEQAELEIIGWYDTDEPYDGPYNNLGVERAYSIASLLSDVDANKLHLSSEKKDLDSTLNYFSASKLNVIFGHQHP